MAADPVPPPGPSAATCLVVGAAILRRGRVLAARRTSPAETAGRWEFPGGKVEPGEEPAAAVVREIAEELGLAVRPTGWLSDEVPVGAGYRLRVAVCAPVNGEPVPHEHDSVLWLGPGELDAVDWLEADRPFLVELERWLVADSSAAQASTQEDSR